MGSISNNQQLLKLFFLMSFLQNFSNVKIIELALIEVQVIVIIKNELRIDLNFNEFKMSEIWRNRMCSSSKRQPTSPSLLSLALFVRILIDLLDHINNRLSTAFQRPS